MNRNRLKEILSDLQKREPILTDNGTIVVSQAHIDEQVTNVEEIIQKYVTYQA